MTDDTPENVITLAKRRRKPVFGPLVMEDFSTHAVRDPDPAAPLRVTLECRGETVGTLATFPDTPTGWEAADAIGKTALNTLSLVMRFHPSGAA
ncbi:UNVERIFIED_ORG: hypothetical protein J2W74_005217 [Methylorubrum zatmanii]